MRVVLLSFALMRIVVADHRCVRCHSRQVASYAKTGMGRSVSQPAPEDSRNARFEHKLSNTAFRSVWKSGKLQQAMVRNGHEAAYAPQWAIGSGNQGKSYLIAVGNALFQSPISWYSERQSWDLSPGFEQDRQPDFFRPITSECLFCHTGGVRARTGTLNEYRDPPFEPASIGCDRCHGDPTTHLVSTKRGDIINPMRLDSERRDAVCEQCHLSGEARIPNPRMQFADYRPGMRMEDVFSVYVMSSADSTKLKVVGHAEGMARSRCYLESRRQMWCGTCHDPHRQPEDKVKWFGDKCQSCHFGKQMISHRQRSGEDCAACHMPSAGSYDGSHTAFHDHWIRVNRRVPAEKNNGLLRAWREPDGALRKRNLGLAYVSVGEKSGSSELLKEGRRLLGTDVADSAVETARGLVLLRAGKAHEAVEVFGRAAEELPDDSTKQLNLAAAQLAAGNRSEAKRNAEKAIFLEPLLEDAYILLAEIEPKRADYWKARYGKLVPKRSLP